MRHPLLGTVHSPTFPAVHPGKYFNKGALTERRALRVPRLIDWRCFTEVITSSGQTGIQALNGPQTILVARLMYGEISASQLDGPTERLMKSGSHNREDVGHICRRL